jgi:hypothetical protein
VVQVRQSDCRAAMQMRVKTVATTRGKKRFTMMVVSDGL